MSPLSPKYDTPFSCQFGISFLSSLFLWVFFPSRKDYLSIFACSVSFLFFSVIFCIFAMSFLFIFFMLNMHNFIQTFYIQQTCTLRNKHVFYLVPSVFSTKCKCVTIIQKSFESELQILLEKNQKIYQYWTYILWSSHQPETFYTDNS